MDVQLVLSADLTDEPVGATEDEFGGLIATSFSESQASNDGASVGGSSGHNTQAVPKRKGRSSDEHGPTKRTREERFKRTAEVVLQHSCPLNPDGHETEHQYPSTFPRTREQSRQDDFSDGLQNHRTAAQSQPENERGTFKAFVSRWQTLHRVGQGIARVQSRQLCSSCNQLDLQWDKFAIKNEDTPATMGNSRADNAAPATGSRSHTRRPTFGKPYIGTLREIMERTEQCSLCRLIARSLSEQKNTLLVKDVTHAEVPIGPSMEARLNLDAKCEVSWHVDGWEKISEEDGTPVECPKTRRLQIQWQDEAYEESHIVLVHPRVLWGPQAPFLGRLLTSYEKPKLDRIREWYQLCLEQHGAGCAIDHNSRRFTDLRQESYFGVIDVKEMMLTYLPEFQRYAALSYTWGKRKPGVRPFKTVLDNIEKLKKPGGIADIEEELPKTIRDAIGLVKSLGIPYLWVDTLCILQEDAEAWTLNAAHMDTVYGHADLTICAADGDNADCGLVALESQFSNAQQYVETIDQDFQLMVCYPSETFISRSVWNTRAWTFQERVLSKRCLVFVEGRVYFQCRTITMSEDIHAEHPQAGWSMELLHGPSQTYKKLVTRPMDVYEYCVPKYTSRNLTDDDDILAAFSGIGREICASLGGEPIFGLPSSHFDFALLWKPDNMPKRRGNEKRPKFPSWSWCGWMSSEIRYPPSFTQGWKNNMHEWLTTHTWITWYIRDGRGNLRLVWDPLLHTSTSGSLAKRLRGYDCKDTKDRTNSTDDREQTPVDRYMRKLDPSISKRSRDIFLKTMPKYPFQVRMVEPGSRSTAPEEPTPLQDQRYLQFWTWSAWFYLLPMTEIPISSKPGKRPGSNLTRFAIQNDHDDTVGTITLGSTYLQTSGEKKYEFIAISEAKEFTNEELDHWSYMEPMQKDQAEWYVYNVLMLEDDGEIAGVSRRAGLGKIYKNGFNTPVCHNGKKKEWKEIILG